MWAARCAACARPAVRAAARQALGLAEHIGLDEVPYVLRGKLAGGLFGTQRFVEKGTLELPDTLASPYRRTP